MIVGILCINYRIVWNDDILYVDIYENELWGILLNICKFIWLNKYSICNGDVSELIIRRKCCWFVISC